MRASIDITLGRRSFAIRPLTLRQVEAIESSLAVPAKSNIDQGVRIVAIGLSRDHGDMTVDALYDSEATGLEIAVAMAVVLRQGGFLTGEALAARSDASTGAPSAVA